MTVQACILFLACAFYLGYLAESSMVEHIGKMVLWSVSVALAFIPICELVYVWIKGAIK